MKKNICLKAYFRKNLGDDMFVRCILERYPNILFKIFASPKYTTAFQNQNNFHLVSHIGWLTDKILKKFIGKSPLKYYYEKSADAVVHIGGSIFIEPDNFVTPKQFYSHPNLYIIGCNFGPYRTEAYRDFIYSRLQKAKDVCFRDQYSYKQFSELEHVRVAPDILFGYPHYPQTQKGYGVGISVIDPTIHPELKYRAEAYYRTIAQIADQLMKNGIPVKLFGFCSAEGDEDAIRKIIEYAEASVIEFCQYNGDIDAMLEEINSCEYIVASRFHAMIIGWALSKKVFPIVYSDKHLNVMKDIEFSGAYWDLREQEIYTATQLIDTIMNCATLDHIDTMKNDFESHFEKLDWDLNGFKKEQ